MTTKEIQKRLFAMQDIGYRDFQAKLIPNIKKEKCIGIRTPLLRAFAKEIFKTCDFSDFLRTLPHEYFDENQLHAFLISEIKDFNTCLYEVNRFLPFVNNWATSDQLLPKIFKKHKNELLPSIKKWILCTPNAANTYTVRFAIGMLMQHFLDDDFKIEYAKLVASVKSEEYYVNMMIAWYFATALAKQYDSTLPFLENHSLEKWTHNKTIQKAQESFRISAEQKAYLKTLKIKGISEKSKIL